MAVTRIKNNQVTDASNGNTQLGINANTKLQNYSITSGKLANNLVYGSDLTVTGNLTVQGNTTQIDTTITTIEDPVIVLASTQTSGAPAVDIGFLGYRGNQSNIAFVWDESASEFVTAFTSTGETNTTVTITSYANFHTNDANIGGNIVVNGTTSLVGNLLSANVTGTVNAGNLLTTGVVSATGTGTFGNVDTGGTVSATGNVTGGNVNTAGAVSATGAITSAANISGANLLTGGLFSAGGNSTAANFLTSGVVSATGNVSGNFFLGNGSQLTGVTASSVDANALTGNTLSSNVTFSSLTTVGTLTSLSVSGNTITGNLATAGLVSATGNVTGGNIVTGGNVDATSAFVNAGAVLASGRVEAGTTMSAAGNITGGANILAAGYISATGNITSGNVNTAGTVSATGNITGGNIRTAGAVSATGNLTGGNVLFGSGIVSGTGNIYGANIIATDAFFGNINLTGDITVNSLTSNTFVSATSNVIAGNVTTGGVVTATGNVTGGNLITGGAVTATGNLSGANVNTSGAVSATGNVTGGNVRTAGLISSTGNIIGGNILTGGLISAAGLATSGNVETAGYVSATGNVYGGNIVSNTITNTSGDVTISAAADLVLEPTGNIVLDGGKWINSLNDPVQAQDAATKQYVDDAVSTGITIHTPVYVESPTALNATYAQGGNTFTVNQTIAGNTVVFSTAANLQPNDQLWFSNSFQGILGNTAYFVVSTPNTSAAVLSTTYNGTPVSNITSATGLTESVRVNSGQGATLTNAGANATLQIDGVTLSNGQRALIYTQANAAHNGVYVVSEAGNASVAWVLTRSSDTNTYAPNDINGLDAGDYFYVQAGDTGAGESYVMTAPIGPFVIGYDNLTFTQFSASQVYTANTNAGLSLTGTVFSAKVDNNTTAFDGGGNIIVKAGANLTTPNIGAATGTSFSATGNIEGGNILTSGYVTATGNVTGGNITTTGVVTATGNITGNYFIGNGSQLTGVTASSVDANALTGNTLSSNVTFSSLTQVGDLTTLSVVGTAIVGNLATAGTISATGNITGGNVNTAGAVSATGSITGGNVNTTGDVTGGNILTGGIISSTGTATLGNVETSGTVSATGNITGGNITTAGQVTATGNITGGNVNTAGTVSATGNITGGNLITSGLITATGVVTSGGFTTTGNVTGGNLLFGSGVVSGTGNIYADTIFANISGNIDAGGANTQIQFNDDDTLAGSPGFTFDKVGNVVTANGNITGANLFTGGSVSATANITGGNILTGGLISATGAITSAANVIGGNISTAGLVTATGNITGGNVLTGGAVSASANITGGNLLTGGLLSATGTLTGSNLILTSGTIDGPASGRITVNGADADIDFAVDGDTLANIFYVDAGTGTASFGASTQVTNAIVNFATTTSIKTPVGNTAQRPGTGVTGMLRFNTTDNNLEIYDNSQWTAVGVPSFTVIDDEQFNGDGSTVAFTLSTSQTTNSCIVSINGVVQIPTLAYSVSTTTLTFTEAPLSGDIIDVRQITTTTTVTSISNTSGNAVIGVSDTAATITAEGNLIPVTDNTYSLGNASNRWSNLYVGGNTIFLGNLQLKEASANTFAVYTSDGVTEANIAVGNIDVTSIQSGTSSISIAAPNGNAVLNAGGVNTLVASNTGVFVTGTVSATGNITGSYFIGNGSQLTGIDATLIQNGTANVRTFLNGNVTTSAGGTANVLNVTSTGAIITGDLSVTGNATLSGNILGDRIQNGNTTIDIQVANGNANVTVGGTSNVAVFATTGVFITGVNSSTGNVTGGNILTAGLISATSSITSAANVTGGNITTAGLITATGNIIGGNIRTAGLLSATSTITSAANITGGNLLTGGLISATGAITGAALTGTSLTVTTGNITAGNLLLSGAIVDSAQLDIQTSASNSNIALAPNGTGIVTVSTQVSAVGNVTGGNIRTAGLISATGAITGAALTGTSLTVSTGNVSCGNIVNNNANGVGNIGSSTTYFNTVFAKATSAQYADLAEKYTADLDYEPGTVVMFGGAEEVTACNTDACRRVAGVISTNPSYIMNGTLQSAHVATVALTGRVPTRVTGTVRKGDMMVSAGNGAARAEADPQVGTVIGKALADFDGIEGVIEVVVGRF